MPPGSQVSSHLGGLNHPALTGAVRELALRGELRRYRKSTILIEEDDIGDTLYVILEGRLRAYSASMNGREITYGVYGPGEYLGEMSLDGGRRSASVETLEASCCSVVTRASLRAFIQDNPDFAFELLSKVIRRARAATISAKTLALNDVYGRIKLRLEELARSALLDGHRPTHQELANWVGCSREMVSRVMKDLETGSYLRIEDKRIVIERPLPPRW
jgi:CRP/FNR family transcriptional regulator, cyclic AMP receptor protein